jgi:hypothetical protein
VFINTALVLYLLFVLFLLLVSCIIILYLKSYHTVHISYIFPAFVSLIRKAALRFIHYVYTRTHDISLSVHPVGNLSKSFQPSGHQWQKNFVFHFNVTRAIILFFCSFIILFRDILTYLIILSHLARVNNTCIIHSLINLFFYITLVILS